MRPRQPITMRRLLWLIVALFVLVASVALVVTLAVDRRELLAHHKAMVMETTHALEEWMTRTISATETLLQHAAEEMAQAPHGDATEWAWFQHFADLLPAGGSLSVIDRDGNLRRYSGAATATATDVNFRDRPFFARHRDEGIVMDIGPVVKSRITGKFVFTVSRRLQDAHGAFAGILLAAIDTENLTDFISPDAKWWRTVVRYCSFALVAMLGLLSLALLALRIIRREEAAHDSLTAALLQKDLLFREVHHRVKNNLQIIASLLRLQARNLPACRECRGGYEDSLGRIQAMAMVHDQLYRDGDLSAIDFGGYLNTLAATRRGGADISGRVSITIAAEPTRLPLDVAIPLAMIANEVFTNTLKHAFPAAQSGTVAMGLKRDGDGQVELTIADDGVGMPERKHDPTAHPTLGLEMVQGLARQIGARTAFESVRGTAFTLTLPAAKACPSDTAPERSLPPIAKRPPARPPAPPPAVAPQAGYGRQTGG